LMHAPLDFSIQKSKKTLKRASENLTSIYSK
jgi:hypothetical protein